MDAEKKSAGRERELADVLASYVDILNRDGAESKKELDFLMKHAGDSEVTKLLHGARAVKALYEAYGDFPDLGAPKPRVRKRKSSSL